MQLADGISVIICCYNSAGRLQPTLEHLAKQQFKTRLDWEIVLVNNASTDNTKQLAEKLWQQLGSPAPLRILDEDKPGTDHARRHGIFAARYAYFVFCDDDNWLQQDYLTLAHHYLVTHPEVGVVGGRSVAVSNVELPNWFNEAAGYYAVGAPAEHTCDISHYGLWGAGMAGVIYNFRVALPAHIPLINAGRVGNSTGMGEDGEMCKRIVLQGLQVHFYDKLVLTHFINIHKLNEKYYQKLLSESTTPTEVISSYYRATYLYKHKGLKRWLLIVLHFMRYMIYKGKSSRDKKVLFSKDLLYYALGNQKLSAPTSEVIKKYMDYLSSNQLKKVVNLSKFAAV